MEAFTHTAFEDHVVNRNNRHAMVVGIIVFHHCTGFTFATARRGEVHGIVETITAECTEFFQTLQVGDGCGRLVLRSQQACIRRDNRITRQASLKTEVRHTKVRILVIHMRVSRIECRFRNAPRQTARGRVVDLTLHNEFVGLI